MSAVIVVIKCIGQVADCEIAHGEVAARGRAADWCYLPESRNRFRDIVGSAFKGDGFCGIGGDGEETDDADDTKGENA